MNLRSKDPGHRAFLLHFLQQKQKSSKIYVFHVFRKIKIRKLHISTFFMNFYIFSYFFKICGSYPGRNRVRTFNLKMQETLWFLSGSEHSISILSNKRSRCVRSLDVWPRVPAIDDVVAPDRVPEPLYAAGMSARCTRFV